MNKKIYTSYFTPGTPIWAVAAAVGAILVVLPSAIWRIIVALDIDVGMTSAWKQAEHIPGWGTLYATTISVLSLILASMTLGLVQKWGQKLPAWVPFMGQKNVPTKLAVGTAVIGALAVIAICVYCAMNWHRIVGFAGMPTPLGYAIVTAAYVPMLAWGPLVLVAAYGYWRRRRKEGI